VSEELYHAVRDGDLRRVTVLIEEGADVRYQREAGYDVLIDAAYGNDVLQNPELIEILRLLIGKGAPLRGTTTYGESAIRVFSRIGRFDAVRMLLEAGANPDDVNLTPMIEAVAFGTLSDVAAALEKGLHVRERDYWERTPWLIAIQMGDVEKAKLLLEHGADMEARGRCGEPSLLYAIENGHIPMVGWLIEIGVDVEQTDDFGTTALRTAVEYGNEKIVDMLLNAGAEVDRQSKTGTALQYANTRNIALKLMEAGADPQHLSHQGRRAILGFDPEPDKELLKAAWIEFELHRSRCFGTRNPERMNNPFWEGMIRSGIDAHQAGRMFWVDSEREASHTPIWCAQRFGQSITLLPDRRTVLVGGEHEDFYDPNFCIYNDVFVCSLDGSIEIYGYPETVFPPTDFHTATLIENFVYLIGSLGYLGRRLYQETPVYRLDITSFEIERVETSGTKPGWISQHRADLIGPKEIRVSGGNVVSLAGGDEVKTQNAQAFILDVERRMWRIESDAA